MEGCDRISGLEVRGPLAHRGRLPGLMLYERGLQKLKNHPCKAVSLAPHRSSTFQIIYPQLCSFYSFSIH